MIPEDLLQGLPDAAMFEQGMRELAGGRETVPALLVAVGFPRLSSLGFGAGLAGGLPAEPELKLYRLLAKQHGTDAHSQYNALLRRLVSFERALEHRVRRGVRHSQEPFAEK